MTILIYMFTIVSNAVFAFRKKQSRFLVVFTLIVICLLMSGAGPEYFSNGGTLDYENYQRAYENLEQGSLDNSYEIGYMLLMKIGNLFRLNFFCFRLLVIAVCLMLVYKLVLKRYAYNSNYVLMMYMIYPMIIDSEHLRNFIALTFLLISIRFLEERKPSNNLKFLMMIFISGCFHSSFFFYVPLIFANTKDKNMLGYMFAIGAVLLTLISILIQDQSAFLNAVSNIFSDDRALNYFSTRTKFGYLIPITLHLISITLVFWSKKIITIKNRESNTQSRSIFREKEHTSINDVEIVNLIFWINVIGMIYFPLFTMSLQFYRLTRNLLLLNIIVYSITSYKFKRGSAYKFGFNLAIIGSLLLWLLMTLTIITKAERVLIPFFTQNVF